MVIIERASHFKSITGQDPCGSDTRGDVRWLSQNLFTSCTIIMVVYSSLLGWGVVGCHAKCHGRIPLRLVNGRCPHRPCMKYPRQSCLPTPQHRLEKLPPHSRNIGNRNILGANRLTFAMIGTITETLLIHLLNHHQCPPFGLRLTLR